MVYALFFVWQLLSFVLFCVVCYTTCSFTKVSSQRAQVVKNKQLLWPEFKPERDAGELDSEEASTDNLPVYVHDASKQFKMRTKMCFGMFIRETNTDSTEKEAAKGNDYDSFEVKEKLPQKAPQLLPKVSNVPRGSQSEVLSVPIET